MNISGFPASTSLSEQSRQSIARLQMQLLEAQKELSTGHYADVGMTLGASTGTTVSLRQDLSRTDAILDSNGYVDTRLKASQAGLQAMSDEAQSFLASLVNAKTSTGSRDALIQQAASGMKAFIENANSAVDGQYLFSGINSDVRPLVDYFAAGSSASQSVDTAFLNKFGVTQTDPSVASIPSSTMQSFLDNEYSNLFNDPMWGTVWSAASDKNVKSRISRTELVDTSVSANDQAFRKLASAFCMINGLGFANMSESTKQVTLDKAISFAGDAISRVANLQTSLGVAQERVSTANETLKLQKNILSNSIDNLEGVDPAEVSTRITNLMTQMETAYALTSRINDLSLLKYL
jgi:flagellar hook-associated protein 3 FlgL